MENQFFIILKAAIEISLFLFLFVLTLLTIEGFRVIRRARRIMDRIDLITDIREWVNVIKFFRRKKKS